MIDMNCCPKCGAKLIEKCRYCSECGYVKKELINKEPTKKIEEKAKPGCLGYLMIIGFAFVPLYILWILIAPMFTSNTNSAHKSNNKTYISVWVEAEDIVKENLKAPSTAKFPSTYSEGDINEIGTNTFIVNSYVDSENSFGANIRSNFSVTILQDGSKYSYKDLSIGSK